MKSATSIERPTQQNWAGIIRPSTNPLAKWEPSPAALSQFEVLVNSFPSQRQRDEFRFLFGKLPDTTQCEIITLHTVCPNVKATLQEHKAELMGLITNALEGNPIPLDVLARVERLKNAIHLETKFADADHIYVYCLATIRARFTDVCVIEEDSTPTLRFQGENPVLDPKTAYLQESFITEVARRFRNEDPVSVTAMVADELSCMHREANAPGAWVH